MASASALASLKDFLADDAATLTPGENAEDAGNGNTESEGDAWETESFYEDVFEQLGDEEYGPVEGEVCTIEESQAYKRLLRRLGMNKFLSQTIESGAVTAKRLCTAFGIPPQPFMEGRPDEAYYPLLAIGIERQLQKRQNLQQYNTIEDAVSLLQKSKNVVVITGAGISTSLGIPDFRSKDTGLYSQLEYLGLSDPQEVFDISLFNEDPTIFYSIAKDILPSTKKFSPTHAFIRLLQDKAKLLTNYTQNIDNLEGHAGIEEGRLVQCHGSFATATCQQCRYRVKGDLIHADIKAGKVPRCISCLRRIQQTRPLGIKRKRSSSHIYKKRKKKRADYEDSTSESEDQEAEIAGIMKPDITFFGEDLPSTFRDRLLKQDIDAVDLVIVIGTSLKVSPVSEAPNFLPHDVPQIYISRDPCQHVEFDIELMGDCDVVVAELARRAGWDFIHEMIPANQVVDVKLTEGFDSRWQFKARSEDMVRKEEPAKIVPKALPELSKSTSVEPAKQIGLKLESDTEDEGDNGGFVHIDLITPEKPRNSIDILGVLPGEFEA